MVFLLCVNEWFSVCTSTYRLIPRPSRAPLLTPSLCPPYPRPSLYLVPFLALLPCHARTCRSIKGKPSSLTYSPHTQLPTGGTGFEKIGTNTEEPKVEGEYVLAECEAGE